jgi:hypothetical protein
VFGGWWLVVGGWSRFLAEFELKAISHERESAGWLSERGEFHEDLDGDGVGLIPSFGERLWSKPGSNRFRWHSTHIGPLAIIIPARQPRTQPTDIPLFQRVLAECFA